MTTNVSSRSLKSTGVASSQPEAARWTTTITVSNGRGASAGWTCRVLSLADLKGNGETRHRFLDLANPRDGRPLKVDADLDGVLKRVGKKMIDVIVNDRAAALPVIEASGTFTDKEGHEDAFSLMVLDDNRFPLVLDHHVRGHDKFFLTTRRSRFRPTATWKSISLRRSVWTCMASTSILPAIACAQNRNRCSAKLPMHSTGTRHGR